MHPQFRTHMTCLRDTNSLHVPVILGCALPRSDAGTLEYEQFCQSMLILFKPWRTPSDAKGGHKSWTSAYNAFKFSASSLSLIANIHVERQCRDAKDSSEWNRRSDENTSLGTLGGLSPELLESMLRNDRHLTECGINIEFNVLEGTQQESNSMQVKLLDKLIGDAKHVGILSQA